MSSTAWGLWVSTSRQVCATSVGRKAALINHCRGPAERPSDLTSSRLTPHCSSMSFMAYCGCSGETAFQASGCMVWSRPGKMTAPPVALAMALSNSRVAGLVPVEPAAMMGPLWTPEAMRCASSLIIWLRLAAGPIKPAACKRAGISTASNPSRLRMAAR